MAKIYMNINARLFYECLSDKTTRCLNPPIPRVTTQDKTAETVPSIFYLLRVTPVSSNQEKNAPSPPPIQNCLGKKTNVYNCHAILNNFG